MEKVIVCRNSFAEADLSECQRAKTAGREWEDNVIHWVFTVDYRTLSVQKCGNRMKFNDPGKSTQKDITPVDFTYHNLCRNWRIVGCGKEFLCRYNLLGKIPLLSATLHIVYNATIRCKSWIILNVSSPFVWLLQGGRLWLGNLQQHPHGVELMMRRFNLGKLDQSDSQRPDISFVVIRSILHGLAHDHLWGHPEKTKWNIYRESLHNEGQWILN